MTVSRPVAVAPEGRDAPDVPLAIDPAPAGAAIPCLRLWHAGRRASCHPAATGLDRPLPAGLAWPAVSASPVPYAPWMPAPEELDRAGMGRVRDAFVDAARRGLAAGYPMLLLDCARGGLLASFVAPLANRRSDAYGGDLAARMRYPLEVLDAVRAAWPADLPVAVAYTAADSVRGGLPMHESLAAARLLAEHGAAVVLVLTGQTVAGSHPEYGRLYGVPYAERVRTVAGVPTIAFGQVTTLDEANTVIAAGRADLCVIDR